MILYLMQIAGAMAERGCSLEEITKAAEQAAGNMGKGKCFRVAGVESVLQVLWV